MEERAKDSTLSDQVEKKGRVFDIQRFSLHDGPGIRTIVFLKGCPLNCLWCSNPEGINHKPELMYFPDRCIDCEACIGVCPKRAITSEKKAIKIDWSKCDSCGSCLALCPSEALCLSGKDMSVEEVMKEVKKDIVFYHISGGGITISGGEPMEQPEFVVLLLWAAREAGINTALETCGYANPEAFLRVIKSVDYLLYDIKHINSEKHRRFTGKGNKIILENAKLAVKACPSVTIRVPFIPGFNDSREEIMEIAAFASSLPVARLHILPYHSFGSSKYKNLGKPYKMDQVRPVKRGWIEKMKCLIEEKYPLKVRVGG